MSSGALHWCGSLSRGRWPPPRSKRCWDCGPRRRFTACAAGASSSVLPSATRRGSRLGSSTATASDRTSPGSSTSSARFRPIRSPSTGSCGSPTKSSRACRSPKRFDGRRLPIPPGGCWPPSVPDLPAGYVTAFPADRPVGLRRRRIAAGTELWRIEATHPADWVWTGFPVPRYRFDPASGAFRVRYAAGSLAGAARERYRDSGLYIPDDHATHHLVRLVAARDLRVFDLRTEKNLDVLRLDDQVSTGQHPDVWDTCHRLSDAVRTWWDDLDALVYRSRTTPATSTNVAFLATDAFRIESWLFADS